MNISISYKQVTSHQEAQAEVDKHLPKFEKLLKSYAPDLIKLHGGFEYHPRKDQKSLSLNLQLPTGTLHATGMGSNVRASCQEAFRELEAQLKKHQSLLRKDYEWKRKRPRGAALSKKS